MVSTRHESLTPRGVGDFAEGPESEIRGRSRATPRWSAASNRVSLRGTMAKAKLLRNGGYSYDQSKHPIAEARRLVGLPPSMQEG